MKQNNYGGQGCGTFRPTRRPTNLGLQPTRLAYNLYATEFAVTGLNLAEGTAGN